MLRIERTPDGQGRVFRLVGALDGGTTRQFERIVAGPIGDGGDVTLDLGDLTECDVAGVESLSVLARRVRVAGGRLLFCSARVRRFARCSKIAISRWERVSERPRTRLRARKSRRPCDRRLSLERGCQMTRTF